MSKKASGYKSAVSGISHVVRALVYVLVFVTLIFLGRTAYVYGYALFNEQAMESSPGEDVTVEIPEGASVKEIAAILRENGLIESENLFEMQERFSAYHGKMKSGSYQLNTSETPTQIMAILSGDTPES
ncbi:MAG: endolytic transglycosylase MltG [Lachnospiraceae bacterium]|nr:endolytic transglycosylase MltG [Lachnospiraceae bacterium]